MGELGVVAVLLIGLFGIILAIAWIVLPFALIGTKPILRELLAEAKKTNALLDAMRTAQPRIGAAD